MRALMRAAILALAIVLAGCASEAALGRPWVRHVVFAGVHSAEDEAALREGIAIEQTSRVPFSQRKYLDAFALETDRKRIEAWYRAHGYFHARVVSAEVKPLDTDSVDVHFLVEEGPPTRIKEVRVTGLDPLGPDADALLGTLDLRPGEIFDHARFLAETAELNVRTRQLGRAWARVDSGVDVDRDHNLATVRVAVDAGPIVRVGRVLTSGELLGLTPARLILHSGLHEGDLLTPDRLENARGRIYNLALFSTVKFSFTPNAADPSLADVRLELHEGPLRQLQLGIGVGIEAERTDVRLKLVRTQRNFLGGLRTLRLSLEPAYVAMPSFWNDSKHGPAVKSEAQLTAPDVFLDLDQLKLTVGYDLGIDYAFQYHGPRAQLAYAYNLLSDHVQLNLSYNFQLLLFFNTDPSILDDPAKAQRLFGYTDPYRIGWWQQDIALDFRDRALDARRGLLLALSMEEGGDFSGSAFVYEKLTPEVRAFLPLGSRVVLASRVRYGRIFVQGDLGSPITRRYYLGGPDSHRGFSYNRLSPQVPSSIAGTPALPVGGDELLLASAELRMRLVKLYGFWVELGAFVDAGDVAAPRCASGGTGGASACAAAASAPAQHLDLTQLHVAAGGGIRYSTVIGTLRADLGVRLNRLGAMEADGRPNPDPGERFAFHISIGEPF